MTGATHSDPLVHANRVRAAMIEEAKMGRHLILVGGGAAALELTGNLWRLVQQIGTAAAITVCGGSDFLACMPAKAQR